MKRYNILQITGLAKQLFTMIFMLSLSANIFAESNPLIENQFNEQWEMASESELDSLRGGFTLANGVVVDFSFEKQIFQNGIQSFSSFYEIPQNVPIVQNGAFNFSIGQPVALLNSVVQNSLDNQAIRTVNTINIDISNLKNINYNAGGVETFRSLISPTFR